MSSNLSIPIHSFLIDFILLLCMSSPVLIGRTLNLFMLFFLPADASDRDSVKVSSFPSVLSAAEMISLWSVSPVLTIPSKLVVWRAEYMLKRINYGN